MNIKKILKIVILNLLVLVAIISIIEFTLFNITKKEVNEKFKIRQVMNKKIGFNCNSNYRYSFKILSFNYEDEKFRMRKPEGLNYKKKPILIFGCSYAYGDGLNNEETFSYKLSHLSKRPVYNRAYLGWGVQHILYQLRRDDFYKEVKNPEYIIYTLMADHINRIVRYQYQPPYNYIDLRYKLTNNGFEEIHPFLKPLWSLYLVNKIQYLIEKKVLTSDIKREDNLQYFYLMLKECKRLAKQHYPDAKFVIFTYRDYDSVFIDNPDFHKKLKDEGFILIDSDELIKPGTLSKDEYKIIDHVHPSGKAWDIIVPALIKKLNL